MVSQQLCVTLLEVAVDSSAMCALRWSDGLKGGVLSLQQLMHLRSQPQCVLLQVCVVTICSSLSENVPVSLLKTVLKSRENSCRPSSQLSQNCLRHLMSSLDAGISITYKWFEYRDGGKAQLGTWWEDIVQETQGRHDNRNKRQNTNKLEHR